MNMFHTLNERTKKTHTSGDQQRHGYSFGTRSAWRYPRPDISPSLCRHQLNIQVTFRQSKPTVVDGYHIVHGRYDLIVDVRRKCCQVAGQRSADKVCMVRIAPQLWSQSIVRLQKLSEKYKKGVLRGNRPGRRTRNRACSNDRTSSGAWRISSTAWMSVATTSQWSSMGILNMEPLCWICSSKRWLSWLSVKRHPHFPVASFNNVLAIPDISYCCEIRHRKWRPYSRDWEELGECSKYKL